MDAVKLKYTNNKTTHYIAKAKGEGATYVIINIIFSCEQPLQVQTVSTHQGIVICIYFPLKKTCMILKDKMLHDD